METSSQVDSTCVHATAEAISLLSWVLAIWVALSFNAVAAAWLAPWIGVPSARQGAAFVLLFVAVLVVGGLLSFVVRRLVRHTGLSGTDRMLGMLFGAARGAVLVIVLVLVAGVTTLPADPWWRGSMLIPYAQRAAFQLAAMLPPDLGRLIDFSATRAPAVATSAGPLPRLIAQHALARPGAGC